MASSRSEKLSKLRTFRYAEDHDYDYIDFLNTIHKENHSVMQSKFPSEDGHDELRQIFEDFLDESPSNFDFEGFDENHDFEGFDENHDLIGNYEDSHLIEYRAEFWNMVENFKQGVDFDLYCNNEDNGVEDNMDAILHYEQK